MVGWRAAAGWRMTLTNQEDEVSPLFLFTASNVKASQQLSVRWQDTKQTTSGSNSFRHGCSCWVWLATVVCLTQSSDLATVGCLSFVGIKGIQETCCPSFAAKQRGRERPSFVDSTRPGRGFQGRMQLDGPCFCLSLDRLCFFFCLLACFYTQDSESLCVRGSFVCAEPVAVT